MTPILIRCKARIIQQHLAVLQTSETPQALPSAYVEATPMAKASTKRRNRISTFFKVMLPGFFNELALPPKFTRNLKGKAYTMATIRDPLGRIWNVEIGGRGEALYFGGEGWMNFLKSLDIGLGFFLLFIHKGKRNFHVKVFDLTACEKEYDEECNVSKCSSQASELTLALYKPSETEAASTLEKLVRQFCKSLGPHFIRTMKFCNLRSEPYLNVPMEFLASYRLDSKCNVTLMDPNGGYWLVKLQIRKRRPVVQCCFHSGWHEFCLQNHLSVGDICVFELKSEEVDSYKIQVHIFRE